MARTGRPRAFDREEAIIRAMHLFWQHGYEGTSLDQLRRAMGGISSASFYAAFGSKEALYRETLSEYLRTHGQVVAALADTSLPPRSRIEQALRRSAAMQTAPTHPTGCMVTLSATIGSEGAMSVQGVTAAERALNRQAIVDCIEAGVEDGSLQPGADVVGLAGLYEGLLVGLSIQARDGLPTATIDGAITQALKAWDAQAGIG